jgi:restriction system protein
MRMSKRNRAGIDQLLQLIARIPWWISVGCAAVAYFVLHALATSPLPKVAQPGQVSALMVGSLWRGLAMAGQYFVPLVLLLGALMGFLKRREAAALVQQAANAPGTAGLNQMTWAQFERLVAETLRRMGYQVLENGGGGADGGIDLHATKGGQRYLVQCKQWRTYRVGVGVVREHFGVITAERAAGGLVVTSGRFTEEAIAFARGKPITLVDGEQLRKAVATVSPSAKPQADRAFDMKPADVEETQPVAPACPVCRGEMVLRQAKQGSNAGRSFWGCRQFPQCRGIRPV